MSVSVRDLLLGATVPPQESVSVPELGITVIVRGMTGVERDAFEVSLVQGRGRHRDVNLKNLRAKLVSYCCINEAGERLFSDADADALGRVRADVLNRLYTVAQRLSGITEEDADELGKASVTVTPSAISSSPSPGSSG